MPDALFSSSSSSSSSSRGPLSPPSPSSSSLRSSSSPAAPAPSSPPPPPSLPSSFAVVAGRLLLEAAGNYTFYLSSDGLAAMEFLGATEEEQGGGSQTAKANAAAPNAAAAALAATAAATLALSRSPLKPLSLLLASPRAVNFSISYVPDPAAASHFLSLEWVFREGGG